MGRSRGEWSFRCIYPLALLTAQRREKVSACVGGTSKTASGSFQSDKREKSTAGSLVLPQAALDIINMQPCFASNPHVFAGQGARPIGGMGRRKLTFDKQAGIAALDHSRSSADSSFARCARAGVRPDIAERVLGHAIKGVEGVYDRHPYREEKANALRQLAGLIDNILRPSDGRVAKD